MLRQIDKFHLQWITSHSKLHKYMKVTSETMVCNQQPSNNTEIRLKTLSS